MGHLATRARQDTSPITRCLIPRDGHLAMPRDGQRWTPRDVDPAREHLARIQLSVTALALMNPNASLRPPRAGVQAPSVRHRSRRRATDARRGVLGDVFGNGVDRKPLPRGSREDRRCLTHPRGRSARDVRCVCPLRPIRCAFAARHHAQALLIPRMSAQGVHPGESSQTRPSLARHRLGGCIRRTAPQ